MTRAERIAKLKERCEPLQSNAIAAYIKLRGPYLPTKGGSKYSVIAWVTFQPWPTTNPDNTFQSAWEFDCQTLNGARCAVRDLWAAMPSAATVRIEGW